MNEHILNRDQQKLLPFLQTFTPQFYLVGGTAIALHLGHRQSIDFDLFTDNTFDPMQIRKKILLTYTIQHTFTQGEGELTILLNKVKITFFHYPYLVHRSMVFKMIQIPDLITLGAMKAFALGKRAKWKDYVDLYFILKQYSFQELVDKTKSIFGNEFNEKLFRVQLAYFEDIDYSEQIMYMKGFERKNKKIQNHLEEISLT